LRISLLGFVALAAAFSALAVASSRAEAGEPASPGPGALYVSAEKLEDEVVVRVGDAVFTRYKISDAQKYPYFYPVNGPRSGKSVTTESSEPYPHHHSLFFGCDRVNGGNYWQEGLERGRIDSREVKVLEPKGGRVVIEDRCVWVRPGAPDVFEDVRRWTISAPSPDLRLIDAEIALKALVDVTIERTNHSLFSIRVVEELSPKGGGNLVDSEGRSGEKETFGKKAKWCGFHGVRGDGSRKGAGGSEGSKAENSGPRKEDAREGIVEGIAILDHPKNPWSPSPWFTRDYGFTSPTPMQWLEGGRLRIEKGRSLRLRYRIAVHAGTPAEAGLDALWDGWAGASPRSPGEATATERS
jgi:hypothetical protein